MSFPPRPVPPPLPPAAPTPVPRRGRRAAWAVLCPGLLLLGLLGADARPAAAQEPGAADEAGVIAVFMECEGRACDLPTYRRSLSWVRWVDDPTAAGVAVTVRGEPRSEGGVEYTLAFSPAEGIGGGPDTLTYRSREDEPEPEEIEALATTMGIGFARYAAIQGYREFVSVRPRRPATGPDPDARVVAPGEVQDPWNLWTFTVGTNGNVNGSATRRTTRLSGNVSANRTTPTWKLSFSGRGSIDRREIERSDGSILEVDEKDGTFNAGITYALADHWSVDLSSLTAKLPSFNQNLRADLTPGVEYSLFPYEEATRRSITLRYTVAVTYRRYEETTIFGKDEEIPWEQGLRLAASMRQPWGDASATVSGSHLLDDVDKHNLSLRGSLSFRVVRGLRFNVGGDIAWVTDQVYLSARGVTDEEALLRLRTRRSRNNKGLNFGFSYEFGSIYNNTVNNRFLGGP